MSTSRRIGQSGGFYSSLTRQLVRPPIFPETPPFPSPSCTASACARAVQASVHSHPSSPFNGRVSAWQFPVCSVPCYPGQQVDERKDRLGPDYSANRESQGEGGGTDHRLERKCRHQLIGSLVRKSAESPAQCEAVPQPGQPHRHSPSSRPDFDTFQTISTSSLKVDREAPK